LKEEKDVGKGEEKGLEGGEKSAGRGRKNNPNDPNNPK
jgi:hypothetical protein